jgi:hypothetical protein
VEYLFVGTMGNIRQSDVESQAALSEVTPSLLRLCINNQNHPYDGISWIKPESKVNQSQRSGRYREQDAVPISG